MKNRTLIYLTALLFLSFACTGNKPTDTDVSSETEKNESVTDTTPIEVVFEENTAPVEFVAPSNTGDQKDYEEFYENGQIKIAGDYDENGERHGLWISYYENGIKWSESYYSHGLREGHSITFFPSGSVRYIGEYKNDEKTGKWTFKDEEGNVVKEEDYTTTE